MGIKNNLTFVIVTYESDKVINDCLSSIPSNNPIKCIDYIWIKGDNIKVVEANIFGNSKATDHKGIKVSLDIK